jgi:protein required for attachment to host cells
MKTHDEEIRQARNADKILNDPVFKEAVESIEKTIIDKMKLVPMADMTTQHELILTLQLLGKLKQHLHSMIETGKMAEIQKESIASKLKRAMR